MPFGNNHFHHFQETARSSFAAELFSLAPLWGNRLTLKKGGMP
jgi:hypothetical protein